MQTSGSFPELNSGIAGKRKMKPASNTNSSMRQIQKAATTDGIGPPKKRRQLTAQPAPKPGNPFTGLNALVGKALKGGGGF